MPKADTKTGRLITLILIMVCITGSSAFAQTPPKQPQFQETPLPAAISLPAPPSVPSDVPNRPITADEAASIALHNQPHVTIARAGVDAAQGKQQQARSGLLPALQLNTSYASRSGGGGIASAGGSASASGYTTSAIVRQLIFDFNHTRELVRQAEALVKSSKAELSIVQFNTISDVKQAFYVFVQNTQLVTVNETNVRSQQEHAALAQAQLNAGVGIPLDIVRAQTAVADAIYSLNVARNSASTSQVNLALMMGIDPRTPIQAAESSEPAPPSEDLNILINEALDHRPEIAQLKTAIQAAQHGLSAAKTNNAPSLGADAGWSQRGSSLLSGTNGLLVGVDLQWNAFDSGLTAGLKKEARANLVSANAQLLSSQLTVVSDVSQAYLNLQTAGQRVETSKAEAFNAKESLRLAEGRYRSGVGTFLDVLDAQAALLTAETNRTNAQTAVNQARVALAHAIGTGIQ